MCFQAVVTLQCCTQLQHPSYVKVYKIHIRIQYRISTIWNKFYHLYKRTDYGNINNPYQYYNFCYIFRKYRTVPYSTQYFLHRIRPWTGAVPVLYRTFTGTCTVPMQYRTWRTGTGTSTWFRTFINTLHNLATVRYRTGTGMMMFYVKFHMCQLRMYNYYAFLQ